MRDYLRSKSLLNTPLKLEILENLKNPKSVKCLVDSLNLSRDTIKPHIKYFVDSKLVERVEEGYVLTNVGEIVLRKSNELESLMKTIEDHGEFFVAHDLHSLPQELLNELRMLKKCQVHKKEDPFEIRKEWFETAKVSRWLKIVSSALYPELLRLCPVLAEGKEKVEVIMTDEVLERAKELYPHITKRCFELGEFYVCKEATEWFWVSDKQLTLFCSRDGMLNPFNAMICNCREGIEWGSRLFDHYLEKSIRVTEL